MYNHKTNKTPKCAAIKDGVNYGTTVLHWNSKTAIKNCVVIYGYITLKLSSLKKHILSHSFCGSGICGHG